MSLTTLMQTIIEIEEIMHAHFKILLAKLFNTCVLFSIVPGLSITCVQATVLDFHNKDFYGTGILTNTSNILLQVVSVFHPCCIDMFTFWKRVQIEFIL